MIKKGILFIVISLLFLTINVEALSVSKNKLEMVKGSNDTIDLYANLEKSVNEIDFALAYTTYDIPAYFKVNENYKLTSEGIKNKIKFNDYLQGKIKLGTIQVKVVESPKDTGGEINITSAYGLDSNGEKIRLNSLSIPIKIVEKIIDNEENNESNDIDEPLEGDKNSNLLKEIKSDLVKITLEEGVYEYQVTVNADVKELDLKPIANDEKAKIEISSQKIDELENNSIKIKVDLNKVHQEYTIKVNQKEKEVKIDDSEITVDKSYKVKWTILAIVLMAALSGIVALSKKFHL